MSIRDRAMAWVGARLAAAETPAPAPVLMPPLDYREEAVRIAASLCRTFEGTYLRPYLCPAAVWTIGTGATYYEDGRRVGPSDPPITAERAEQLLQWMLRTQYLPQVMALCPGVTDPNLLAALLDFAYNCGVGNLRASTLRKKVNAGDFAAVPAEFRKWVRAAGQILRGLVRRREAEVALFA